MIISNINPFVEEIYIDTLIDNDSHCLGPPIMVNLFKEYKSIVPCSKLKRCYFETESIENWGQPARYTENPDYFDVYNKDFIDIYLYDFIMRNNHKIKKSKYKCTENLFTVEVT